VTPEALRGALRLVVILDQGAARGRALPGLAAAAAAGGATMLQVRAKALAAGSLVDAVRAVRGAAPRVPVVVNDRLDVAVAAGADGCHLGQDDLPLDAARRAAPPGFVLGGSAGNDAELRRACGEGADYLGIGPVHSSPSKNDAGSAIGLAGFERLCRAAAVPCVGIGGLAATDAAGLAAAGAAGMAVIGAALSSDDVAAAVAGLRRHADAAWRRPS
jgi:thiamine-phosphate pyrophosphorylase